MKESLVLLTLDYPDPLLDKELPYLAEAFDTIYLLPTRLSDSKKTVHRCHLPENVKVFSICKETKLHKPWKLIRKHFFTICRIYGSTIIRSAYWRYYIIYIRSFLGHLLLEAEKIEPLSNFIKSQKLADAI